MELSVLVVDDDFMVARVHSGYVERTPGFRVAGIAHNGEDAVRQALETGPDLVLLDLYLPDRPGLGVLREVRARRPEIDFMVVSAARDTDTVREAQRAGAVNYLIKPFDHRDLRVRLDRYLAAHRAMAGSSTTDQASVDHLFAGPGPDPQRTPGGRPGLPKGLSTDTAGLVERTLRAHFPEDLSAAECAEHTGLSRVSARRYLEHFTSTGEAEVHLRYGTAGRPERRYTWRA